MRVSRWMLGSTEIMIYPARVWCCTQRSHSALLRRRGIFPLFKSPLRQKPSRTVGILPHNNAKREVVGDEKRISLKEEVQCNAPIVVHQTGKRIMIGNLKYLRL